MSRVPPHDLKPPPLRRRRRPLVIAQYNEDKTDVYDLILTALHLVNRFNLPNKKTGKSKTYKQVSVPLKFHLMFMQID